MGGDAFLVLLANRDESYERSFTPPEAWPGPEGIVAPRWTAFAPGVHVLSNLHDLDAFPVPRGGEDRAGEPIGATLRRLESLANDREPSLPGGHSICKVGATRGTVCSAVRALPGDRSRRATFRFAPGPPHGTPFRDAG